MKWFEIASLVASLATTLAAVAVVFTVAIYYGQLRAMTKSRDLDPDSSGVARRLRGGMTSESIVWLRLPLVNGVARHRLRTQVIPKA